MATRTRSRSAGQATPTVTYRSKSDHARTLLRSGMSVADTARTVGIGYAFAYGIASRAGLAATAAHRRPTAAVKSDPDSGIVTVRCDTGDVIRIDRATGKVTRRKS